MCHPTEQNRSGTSLKERLRAAVRETQRLRRELRHARSAVSREAEMVFIVDLARGQYEYVSSNAKKLTGFSADEWHELGPTFMLKRFPGPDLAAMGWRLQQAVDRARGRSAQTTVVHRWTDKSNRLHWCLASISLSLNRRKGLIGTTTVVRECTPWERADNELILCPKRGVPSILLPAFPAGWETQARECPLSSAECAILHLILRGLTNKQIAGYLHRSRRTIEDHRCKLMRRLHATTTADLVLKALEHTCPDPSAWEE